MDKKIKDLIAEKKFSDEDIYKLLTAEPPVADTEEQEEDEPENQSDSDDDEIEEEEVEEDATEEQPDIRSMIKEVLAEELSLMKRGKKKAKVVKAKKPAAKTVQYNYNQEFGAL